MTVWGLAQNPAVAVGVFEHGKAAPRLFGDRRHHEAARCQQRNIGVDIVAVEHHALQAARLHGVEPRDQGDGGGAAWWSQLNPGLAWAHRAFAYQLESEDVAVKGFGGLRICNWNRNNFERRNCHARTLAQVGMGLLPRWRCQPLRNAALMLAARKHQGGGLPVDAGTERGHG